MANNQINFNINFKTNTSGLKQARDAIDQITGKLTGKQVELFNPNSMKSGIKMINEAMNAAGRFEEAMTSAYNVKIGTVNLERFNQELAKNGTSIQDVRDKMLALGPAGEQSYAKMASGLMSVRYETVETTTLLDKLGDSLRRALLTFTSLNIINKVKGSIGEAYGYVKNLDTSLNQIRIVTGKSADEMERFANTANKAAASLGKATTDYTKASTTFYQQGLSDTEVEARTRVTLMASNTTGADTKQVADQLTAIWNGFNVGAEDAEHYIDVVAAVAKSTASNLDEMATAMSKVASMADSMGVSEEQLAAQMSTVIAVTRQAPESVGTAFKTIYARIADIKAGSEDAEISLGNYSGQLAALGINVLDAAGNLKDMGQIIEEVGGSWQNYSKEQQVAIAGIMGGQRQVNQLRALFDNWDKYAETMKVAANAEGELQKEQDIFMESAQGQLQKLRTEWEGVLDSLLSSDDIIKVAKAISPLITGLEKMVDAFGGGIGILQKFSPLLLQIVSPQISKSIGKMANSFNAAKTNAKLAAQQVEIWNSSLKNTQFNDKYAQSIKEIRQNYINLIDTMSVEERNSFEESMDRFINVTAREINRSFEEIANEYKNLQNQLSTEGKIIKIGDEGDLEKTQQNIQKIINGLDTIDELSLRSRSGELFKKNWFGYDDKIKGITGQLEKVKQMYDGELPNSVQAFDNALKHFKGLAGTEDDIQALESAYKRFISDIANDTESLRKYGDAIKELFKKMQEAEQQEDKFNSRFKQLNAQQTAQSFVSIAQGIGAIASAIQQVQNLGNIWKDEDLTTNEKVIQTLITLSSIISVLIFSTKGLTDGILNLTLSFIGNVVAQHSDTVASELNAVSRNGQEKITWKLVLANNALRLSFGGVALAAMALVGIIIYVIKRIKEAEEAHHTAEKRLKEVSKQLEETTKKIEEVNSAWENYKSSVDALSKLKKGTEEYANAVVDLNNKVLELIDTYPELAAFMKMTDGGRLEISTEGWEWLQDFLQNQKLEETRDKIFAKYDKAEEDYDNYKRKIDDNVISTAEEDKWINSFNEKHGTTYQNAQAIRDDLISKNVDKVVGELEAGSDLDQLIQDYYGQYDKATQEERKKEIELYQDLLSYDDDIRNAVDLNNQAQEKLKKAQQKTDITAILGTYRQYNEKYSGEQLSALANILYTENDGNSDLIRTAITDFDINKEKLQKIKAAEKIGQEQGINLSAIATGDISSMSDTLSEEIRNELITTYRMTEEEVNEINKEYIKRFRDLQRGMSTRAIASNSKLGIGIAEKFNKNIEGVSDETEKQLGADNGLAALDDSIDIETFTDFLSKADTQEGLEAFNGYLEQAGIEFESLPEGVQKYIKALENLNQITSVSISTVDGLMTAMGKMSTMKFGDTISAKDFEEIQSYLKKAGVEVDKYFTKVGDKYKFIETDNKELMKDMSKAFVQKTKEAEKEFEGLKRINESYWQPSMISTLGDNVLNSLEGWTADEARNVINQVQKGTADEETQERYNDLIEKIKQAAENDKAYQEAREGWLDEYVGSYVHSMEDLQFAIENEVMTEEEAEARKDQVRKEELQNLGISEQAYKDYIESQKETLENLSPEDEAKLMLEIKIKINKDEAIKGINDTIKQINADPKKDELTYTIAAGQMEQSLQKLGVDTSKLTEDYDMIAFIKDYELYIKGALTDTTKLDQALALLFDGESEKGWNILDEGVKKYNADLKQTQDELRKTSLEQQKTTIESEKSLVQNSRKKVEDQMSHATGQEYLNLQKKRNEQLEKEYQKTVEIQKINLEILKLEQAITRAKAESLIQDGKTVDELLKMSEEELADYAVGNAEAAQTIVTLKGQQLTIEMTEKQNAQELEDFYEKQWLTIDEILDEKRQITNLDKQINRLEKEAQFLTGEALTKNLEEQRKLKKDNLNLKIQELALQKEELEDSKKVLENLDLKGQRDKDNNALSGNLKDYLASQNIEINYDDFGGVSNLEEILNAVNGSSFADEVQNWINKINDCADATYELEDALLEAAESISSGYDEETRMKELDLRKKRLQKEQSQYNPNSDEYKNITKEIENIDAKRLEQQEHKYADYLGEEYKNAETALNESFEKANIPLKKTEDGSVILEPIKEQLGDSYNAVKDYIEKHKDDLNLEKKEGESDEEFAKRKEEAETKYRKGLEEAAGGYYDLALVLKDGIKYNEINSEKLSQAVDIYSQTIDNWNQKGENIEKISQGKINDINKISKEVSADESLLYGDAKIANLERQGELQEQIVDTVKEEIKQREKLVEEIDKQINEIKKIPEDERSEAEKAKLSALEASRAKQMESISDLEIKKNEEVRKSIELQKKAYQEKLKIAEEAIKRESSAQHQLKNSLKEVDRALNKVKKDQEGLSGPALIAKLQEEIALQEQKKKILEQQLSLVKAQIQSLVALYTTEMSKRFEVPISFVVDENGVANLDELYASVAKMPEKLQAEGQQAIQSAISNLNSLASNMSSIQSSIDGMTDSIESLNKKIKETKEAEAFRLKDEKWYKIDQELKSINKELARLQRLQKHLVGDALIKNLTQQQELLEKQAQAQANKLATMKAELQVMQQMLAMQGVMFDSDGLIANYATVFAQGNDKVNGYMKSYQSLYDSIQDLEEGIQETFDKKLDLEYEKAAERLRLFNAKIDIELDLGKAKREWQNFKREFLNTLNGMQQLNDSLAEKAKQGLREIMDISVRETPMLTDHVEQIMEEIRLMQAGGWSNLYGTDQETALSDLANYRQQLQDSLSAVADKIKEIEETYLQQLEKIKGKFDEQLSNYEQIQSIIEHDINLIKILKGEQSYDLLANYYDKSTKNYEAQISMLKNQVNYWKNLMDQAQPGTEEWQTFQQNWKDALSKLNSAVDAALSNLISKYENAINKTFAALEKQFTNGTDFDWIKTQWDWANKEADLYLDKISQEYNIQKLNNKYQEAANKATDPNQRARILKIMDEELKKLREKDKLTKYDVERANKMYDLRMKQLELEDAANNKTKMRLRRDSEGNYRYEYVADQDKVAELKQEILDMQEEIRQFDLSALREKKQEAIQILQEFNDQARELTLQKLKGEITEEEYNERINALKNHFETMYGASAEAIDNITKNLEQSTTAEMVSLDMITEEELKKMRESAGAIGEMIKGITPIYDDMINNLINHIAGEGGFTAISEQAIEELKQTLIDFTNEISKIEEAAGVTFESITNGIDPTIDMMYDLIDVNDDLINKYQEELDAISDLIAELHDLEMTYQDVYDAAMRAVDAALELRRTEMDYNDNSNVNGSGVAAVGGYSASSAKPSTSTSSSGSAAKASIPAALTKNKNYVWAKTADGEIIKIKNPEKLDSYYDSKDGTSKTDSGKTKIVTLDDNKKWKIGDRRQQEVVAYGTSKEELEKLYHADVSLATGGYTGSWGSEGKIAMLHEKELVLNKEDTANILAAVQSTRASSGMNINSDYLAGISHSVDNIYDAVMRLLEVTSASLNTSLNAAGTVANTQSNVSNTINANFPNAGNMNEIQNALMNLTNYTSQRLHSNQRGKSGTAQSSTYRTKSF